MFVGTVSVSWREMGLHLIDPVPPLPHGQRTIHSAIISALMLSFLMCKTSLQSQPHCHSADQHKYKRPQTKGKDNNGYHIEKATQKDSCLKESILAHAEIFPQVQYSKLKVTKKNFLQSDYLSVLDCL